MKKVFFPLLAIAGLTAMSFTDVKAETREVKEVSMDEAVEAVEGSKIIQYKVWKNIVERNVWSEDLIGEIEDIDTFSKMENILSKY